MGLEINTALFLKQALAEGCTFRETATLGHQTLFLRWSALQEHFPMIDPATEERYADRFLRDAFGAERVTSFDASAFEEATIVHDMNLPIAAEWHERFDTVIEMGSLEHIFNFPVAVTNLMRMTKVGGHLLIVTPANNHFGHGFYQFGPDLFYRLLCAANGFQIERMYAFEHRYLGPEIGNCGPWYEVRDPAVVGERAIVISENPMLLMLRARRIAPGLGPIATPQQSDYVVKWQDGAAPGNTVAAQVAAPSLKIRLRDFLRSHCAPLYSRLLHARFRQIRERERQTAHTLDGSPCFRRTDLQADSPTM